MMSEVTFIIVKLMFLAVILFGFKKLYKCSLFGPWPFPDDFYGNFKIFLIIFCSLVLATISTHAVEFLYELA